MEPRGAAIVGLCVAALAVLAACWGQGSTPGHPTGVTTTATGIVTTAPGQGGDEVPTGAATATMAEGSPATPGPLFPEPSAIPPSPSTPDSPVEPTPWLTEPLTPSPTLPPGPLLPEVTPTLTPEPTSPTVTTTTGQ